MLLEELTHIRKNESHLIGYLRPDSKSQVTIEYTEKNIPSKIESIVVSTQHDEFDDEHKMLNKIREDIINIVIPTKIIIPNSRLLCSKGYQGTTNTNINMTAAKSMIRSRITVPKA